MLHHYKEFYKEHFSPKRYENYQKKFKGEVGKLYSLSTSPYFLKEKIYKRIKNEILPTIVKFLNSEQYKKEVYKRGWFLPKKEVKIEDFWGCCDFHISEDEMKLIEVNFFIPGQFAFKELFPKLFEESFEIDLDYLSKGFEKELADFLIKRFNNKKVAIAVNHTGLSKHYFEHYKYLEKVLRENFLECEIVFAKDASLSSSGKPMWGDEEYGGVLNLVIPRIWEHNYEEFSSYSELFSKCSDDFFPNPWCWTMGDKRVLNKLNILKEGDYDLSSKEVEILKSITLSSKSLKDLNSLSELESLFGGSENMVLKPIDNFHTQGVYIKPTKEEMDIAFNSDLEYIAQEYFSADKLYYKDENGNEVKPWRSQLRVEFFQGELFNLRSYGYSDPFGLSPMTPVKIV